MTKKLFFCTICMSVLVLLSCNNSHKTTTQEETRQPNIIVIFADDLGYGDLGVFGHPTIRTPNLDKMANEGMKFTQFYTGANVCTPSRAALLTGRLPIRSGMCSSKRRVLFPNSGGGLPQEEITIAEALKDNGYATACIGKWHLGHLPQFMPNNNGFDYYFGIPYSNDMEVVKRGDPPLPILENKDTVEAPAIQTTLTKRYTEKAIQFITDHRDQPFFLYYPHTFPHIPLFASEDFRGKSPRGLYGDVVEEIDWSVGQLLKTLQQYEIDEHTLVVFTSDNGPWLVMNERGGSAGLLREGKGTTWDGGMRVPAIFRWPGTIPAGIVQTHVSSTMDLFPTALAMAGSELPGERIYDGHNIIPLLKGENFEDDEVIFYYWGTSIYAIRKGPWKAHFTTHTPYRGQPHITHDPPLLYNLEEDPSERHNLNEDHQEVIERLKVLVVEHQQSLDSIPSQLEIPMTMNN